VIIGKPIVYSTVAGPITIVCDDSIEPGTARLVPAWRHASVNPQESEEIKKECEKLVLKELGL